MKKTILILGSAACLLASAGADLMGGAPLKINFQGRLSESGQPAGGSKTFVFKIYDALSGGTLVWTSQAQSIALSEGAFSAALSAGTPAALSTATFAGARYVEITVDGVVLSPRQEMASAPYALVAQALAADADIPPSAIAAGSVTDYHAALTTAAVTSGRFADDRVLITTGAFAALNGADQLVKLDGSGKLPLLDGSALTNVAAASYSGSVAVSQLSGLINDARLAISTGAFPALNGADQLVKLDSSGKLPLLDGSALTNVAAASYSGSVAASQLTGVINDNRLAISTGAFAGGFNAAEKLVRMTADNKLPAADGSLLTGFTASQVPSLDSSKIASGKFYDAQLAISTGAFPGGFNTADQLVKLDGSGKLPLLDGSALTNVAAASYSGSVAVSQLSGLINDARLAISTGAFPALNGADQLVKLDSAGKLPLLDGSALTNVAAASYSGSVAASQLTGVINDNRLAVSTGAFPGGFNAADKLVQLDASGRLKVGTASANSVLTVGGAISVPVSTVTYAQNPYSVTANDSTLLIWVGEGVGENIVINLPDATTATGRTYVFKRLSPSPGNSISIHPANNQLIEDTPGGDYLLDSQWQFVTLQSIGDSWIRLAYN